MSTDLAIPPQQASQQQYQQHRQQQHQHQQQQQQSTAAAAGPLPPPPPPPNNQQQAAANAAATIANASSMQPESQSPSNSDDAISNVTSTNKGGTKPVRAMLARGAACDLCRARKVKCTGEKPICAQCLKSARGNAAACNCVYDGGSANKLGIKKPRVKKVQSLDGSSIPEAASSLSSPSSSAVTAAAAADSMKAGGALGGGRRDSATTADASIMMLSTSDPVMLAPLRPYQQPHPFQKTNTADAPLGPQSTSSSMATAAATTVAPLPMSTQLPQPVASSTASGLPPSLPPLHPAHYAASSSATSNKMPILPSISAFYPTIEKRSYAEMSGLPKPVARAQAPSDDDDDDEDDEEEEQLLAGPPALIPEPGDGRPRKKQATNTDVEQLVERITELERRLKIQSQPQIAPRVSVASPSYFAPSPYPAAAGYGPVSPYGGPGSPYARSYAMDHRRSLSRSGEIPINTDISSAWTPESSCRFDADGPADPNASRVRPGSSSGAYASFIPPSSYGEAMPSASINRANAFSKHVLPSYANSSSYPPLDFDNSSVLSAPSSGGSGGPSPPPTVRLGSYGSNANTKSSAPTSDAEWGAKATPIVASGFASSEASSLAGQSPDDTFGLDASLYQLLYPSWSSTLPGPAIVRHVISVFFNRATVVRTIFDRVRFTDALRKAPSEAGFPEVALLHALMAYAVVFVSQESLRESMSNLAYWSSEKSPRDYHFKQAKQALVNAVPKSNLFQLVQAAVVMCYVSYQQGEFHDLWNLSSLATRNCVMLGLNHLSPPGMPHYPDWGKLVKGAQVSGSAAMLAPPRDARERYERAATFWTAFAIDRLTSAATDWAPSIDEKDITTHLPYLALPDGSNAIDMTVDHMTGQMPSLSIRNPRLFLDKSDSIGSLGLYIKGTVLLGRVVNYLQRLPRLPILPPGETCHSFRRKFMDTPEFQELDLAVARYRTLIGADFIDKDGQMDHHLASAYCMPHVASILLQEAMVSSTEEGDTSPLEKSLRSSKCIVSATLLVASMTDDCTGADPFTPFIWSVVGRSLVRDYAIRSMWGHTEAATASRQLAEQILVFAESCGRRMAIGTTVATVLRKLMAAPECLVPVDDPVQCILAQQMNTRWEIVPSTCG